MNRNRKTGISIIAVDDEEAALWALERAILEADPTASAKCFFSAEEALAFARDNKVDVAFLDIEMVEMSGLTLAKLLKGIYTHINIVFVTGHSSYTGNAIKLRASGYVVKPVDAQQISEELDNLRNPVNAPDTGVRIQCFGNFDVFADGKPVIFGRPKAKEILAYLVDRKGASVSKKELAAILWGDKPYDHSVQSHLYVLITDLIQTLDKAGARDLIVKSRGLYSIDAEKILCDYYSFENGEAWGLNSYRGEYMNNYSWGEGRLKSFEKF